MAASSSDKHPSDRLMAGDRPVSEVHQAGDTPTARTPLSLSDGEAIKAALLRALENSTIGDREQLLSMTKTATVWINSEGKLRIGAWTLLSEGGARRLVYRMSAGPGPAFTAELEKKADQWQVGTPQTYHIHPRR